jgi:hypothetical protein
MNSADITSHQINILSQILLVCLLQPMLSKSASPRVVFTTSEVHAWAPSEPIANVLKEEGSIVNWADSEDKYDNTSRYFLSKVIHVLSLCGDRYSLGQLLLQMAIRAMLPLSTVNIVSVNPGLCRSNLGRDMQFSGLKGIGTAIWFLTTARSPETGARNVTHAMFAKDSYEVRTPFSDCHFARYADDLSIGATVRRNLDQACSCHPRRACRPANSTGRR